MPTYPTPGAYQEAIQHPETAFFDPELQQAHPEEQVWGLPRIITGAFAAVFPVRGRTRRLAVRCFLTEVPDQARRYRALARHLQETGPAWAVLFDYQPEGIRVGDGVFPVLKMEWAEGIPLNTFVARHLDAPEVLARLDAAWCALLDDMERAGVAHGDLQHGNVLVVEEESTLRLRLVDYDTMYVPALRGRKSPEIGHRNYQHPDRSQEHFGPYLDRFPGLVVHVALRALQVRPALWERYDTGENLLFQAADFYDPAGSPLLAELAGIPEVASLAETLRKACLVEMDALPPLAALRGGREVGRPRRRRVVRRGRREGRVFLGMTAGGLAGSVLVGGLAGVGAGLGALALVGAGLSTWVHRRYVRLPWVRRRRRLRQEIAYIDRLLARIERQAEARRTERRQVLGRREALLDERLRELRTRALHDRLKHHFLDELCRDEGLSHKVVVRLKAAGLRTAVHLTPERMQRVTGLSDASRARVMQWRERLEATYAPELPGELAPAEVRRIERYLEHRMESIDAELGRLLEKRALQQAEREHAEKRLAALPRFGAGAYVLHLLGFRALPDGVSARPVPVHAPRREHPSGTSPVPTSPGEHEPWWRA